jgi:sugar/nucleoside kinase (ribokinase family)
MADAPALIVIGDLMLDVTAAAGSLARGGDVHGDVRLDPGGSAANVAAWAAHAGANVTVVGSVGDDAGGHILLESLRARGVRPAVRVAAGSRTGLMLVFSEAGERSMVAHRGANSRLTVDDLPDPIEAAAVFVSGYTLFDRSTEAVALEAMARARARYIATDAASWPLIATRGASAFFSMTSRAGILFANEREAETLTGRQDEAAARALADRYEIAVVKLGARGAVAALGSGLLCAPAVPVTEIDSTGAGDAFDGTFLAALATGRSPEAALEAACAAGARCAAQPGRWPEGNPR